MKYIRHLQSFRCLILFGMASLNLNPHLLANLPESLTIEVKNVVQWDTLSEQSYQLQKSTNSNSWEDITIEEQSNGNQVQYEISTIEPVTE